MMDMNISYFTVRNDHSMTVIRQSLRRTQIPLALVLPLTARFYSGLSGPGAKLFDRNDPRGFVDKLKQTDMDEEVPHITECTKTHADQTPATEPPDPSRSMFSKWL